MKLTGIFLVLLSGVLLILKIYTTHSQKISFLKKLTSDLEVLKNEILFLKTPVYDAFLNLECDGICGNFYSEILSSLEKGFSVKESFSKGFSTVSYLFGSEAEMIFSDFGNLLGATASEGQEAAFTSFICGLNKISEESELEKKEKLKPRCAAILFIFVSAVLFII